MLLDDQQVMLNAEFTMDDYTRGNNQLHAVVLACGGIVKRHDSDILPGLSEDKHAINWPQILKGEVLAGRAPGRSDAQQITLYKSLGVASQDLAAGLRAFRAAVAADLGHDLDLAELT